MKKILFSLLVVLVVSISAKAQNYSDIWGKGRYLNISYSFAQTATDFDPVQKGKFGVALTKGTSYLFPGNPIAGYFKVGFDVNWMDISFAKYKSSTIWDVDIPGTSFGDEYEGFDKLMNLGRMSLMVGALGIGPNVTVTPFVSFDNAAKYIKASIYFHYQPTFGVYLVSEDGDIEASYAYCNMFQLGGKIQWKFIGLGVEGHWGSGKFNQIGFEAPEYGDFFEDSGNGKIKRKFANTRVYVSFSF